VSLFYLVIRLALLLLWLAPLFAADVFPVAVWYGGGKARAPMLASAPGEHREEWRRDLQQIRALGFNTIRCWIDWASGEPKQGDYRFETIDTLLELAEQEHLRVVIQVYMDSAPDWVGRQFPDSLYVSASGAVMIPESAPGYCRDHPGVGKAEVAFYEALARRHQLGDGHVSDQSRVLFLPSYRSAVPSLAAKEVRLSR
jgi:beta-galactosidase GanA